MHLKHACLPDFTTRALVLSGTEMLPASRTAFRETWVLQLIASRTPACD